LETEEPSSVSSELFLHCRQPVNYARTTQIYINTGDQSRLDQMGFSPFGNVSEGMDVVYHLYSGYGETSGGGMLLAIRTSYLKVATHIWIGNFLC
jgi:cyclophilin family peptidyl-prolyl cis-trans isomerase